MALRPWLKQRSVRTLLAMSYGGTILATFALMLIVTAVSVYTLRDQVLEESTESLRQQVVDNSNHILSESADVFVQRLHTGLQGFALPATKAFMDASRTDRAYALAFTQSYADSNASFLKPPLTTDVRFPCVAEEAAELQAMRGCQDGLRSLSLGASSLYVYGMLFDGSNAEQMIAAFSATAERTAAMDLYVQKPVSLSEVYLDAYLGAADGSMFRIFPGYVGNLDYNAATGVRTYNPVIRPWYAAYTTPGGPSVQTKIDQHGRVTYDVRYSGPYASSAGEGVIISITVPAQDPAGSVLGVGGTDLFSASLQNIVSEVRIRTSGQAHLYHIPSFLVAASPQWTPAQSSDVMPAGNIELHPGYSTATLGSAPCEGTQEVDQSLVMRRQTLEGDYCLVAVVPVSEVEEGIERQRQEIMDTSNMLFVYTLAVLLGSFLLIVSPCACLIAYQLSTPLVNISKESSQMVRNIGGDLLEGVGAERKSTGVGEVAMLRYGFVRMLWHLKIKRDPEAVPPANPCFEKIHLYGSDGVMDGVEEPGKATERLEQLELVRGDAPMLRRSSTDFVAPTTVTVFNRISTRLALQLVLPTVLALTLIIVVTAVLMFQYLDDWLGPVSTAMVREELQTLDVRCYERERLVAELFSAYSLTVKMMQDYTERLYNGETALATGSLGVYTPWEHFGSVGACNAAVGDCTEPSLYDDLGRALDSSGNPSRQINVDTSAWYSPMAQVAPASQRYAPSSGVRAAEPTVQQEQAAFPSYLEQLARLAYFSSNATYVYWGFEQYEVYRQYPYMDLSSLLGAMSCNDAAETQIAKYTPLCRGWYTNARYAAAGQVVFNPVDVDALTSFPYLPLSVPVRTNASEFVGVASVDVNLGQLEKTLLGTRLYNSGRAYMFDSNGKGIIHPNLDQAAKQSGENMDIHILASEGDAAFAAAYLVGVVGEHGNVGTWAWDWYNPATDEMETWHYSFRPVSGTPYQLVLTVVDREVEQRVTDLEDRMHALTVRHIVLCSVLSFVAAALTVAITWFVQLRFVRPVKRLEQIISASEKAGFATQLEEDPNIWSRELRVALANIQKLLIALRFANPDYHKGDKLRELENIREARAMVESTGSMRGIGVVASQLGNCVRGMTPETRRRARLTAGEADVVQNLTNAVENAKMCVCKGEVAVPEDTVGQRLLGLAVACLAQGCTESCADALREAVQVHTRTGSWQALARIPYAVASPDLPPSVHEIVLSAAWLAVDQATREPSIKPQDDTSLAQLCWGLAIVEDEPEFALFALERIPHMELPMVVRLAMAVKAKGNALAVTQVDEVMSAVPGIKWRTGSVASGGGFVAAPQTKTVQFVLDASGSMAGAFLRTCKQSILSILENHTSDGDRVGFIAFAHFTKEIFPLTKKAGNEEHMRRQVNAVDTFGGTAFYDAVMDGLRSVETLAPGEPKWIVALTDGADGHSKRDAEGRTACKLLGSIPNVNIAVITVGQLPAKTIETVKRYVKAVEGAGNKGLHIVAGNTQSIAEAFETIGSLMADDVLGEHL